MSASSVSVSSLPSGSEASPNYGRSLRAPSDASPGYGRKSSEFLTSMADIRRLSMPLHWDQMSLVGRSEEIDCLTKTMERVRCQGATAEIALVHGESGCGKTKLVQVFEQNESKRKEFWVSSKFGQYDMGSRPLGAIIDATTELWIAIQASDKDDIIRRRISENLHESELQMLAAVIPALEDVLSEAGPVQRAREGDGANEHTFTRITSLYRKFLASICTPQNPSVMFLDDVQWADDVSTQLIASIARETSIKNFLLVCAFRDGQDYKFALPEETALNVTDLSIQGLSIEDVNILTSKAIGVRAEETAELGAVVHGKTGGNCFFVHQYIEMLHREELLFFDWTNGRFQWNLEKVRARTDVSDNIAAIVASKIESMSQSVQFLLILASCLGYTFQRKVLQTVFNVIDIKYLFGDDLFAGEQIHASLCALLGDEHSTEMSTKVMVTEECSPPQRRRGSRILLEDVEESLTIAATESNEQQLEEGSSVATSSSQLIKSRLADAVAAGLIEKVSEGKYKFSHDRIQQSAFSMLPEGKKGEKFQTKLGETILQLSRSSASEGWMLFTAVDLLTKFENSMNKTELAELCLEAALAASSQAAFLAASRYASAGIDLIKQEEGWRDDYDLALQLHNVGAEMYYANGEIKTCRKIIDEILKHSKRIEDPFRAYNVLMDTFGAEQDWKGGTSKGLLILEKLGIKAPRRPNTLHIVLQLTKAKRLLKGRKAQDIESLPNVNDPVVEEASRIIASTSQAAWHIGESNLTTYLCLEMFLLTLKHGICIYSPYACTMYGGTMSHIGDFEEAYEYGEIAVQMLERPEMALIAAKTTMIAHGFLLYLKRPVQDSLEPLIRGYQVGMQTGKILDAVFNLQVRVNLTIFAGMRLQDFYTETKGFIDFHHEYKQMGVLYKILPWFQLGENLLGNTKDPLKLIGSGMNEDEVLRKYGGDRNHLILMIAIHQARMVLLYLLGAHEAAEADRLKYDSYKGEMSTYVLRFYAYFFKGMNCLAMARTCSRRRLRYYKRQATRYRKELEKYAQAGCVNAVPMLALMSAEFYALERSNDKALDEYYRAISVSTRCGFRMFTGIAYERRGAYLLETGNAEDGTESMQRAFNEFCWYGAKAKTDQMIQKYNVVMSFSREAESQDSISSARFQPFLLKEWQQGEAERRSSDLNLHDGTR